MTLFTLLLYLFTHTLFNGNPNINLLTIPCFVFLLVIFQSSNDGDFETYKRLIIIAASIQSIYGILQYVHILPDHTLFPIVGRFDNPAGFASCMIASLPFCLFSCDTKTKWGILSIICTGLIVAAIVLSNSRAGMLCTMVLSFIYCCHRFIKSVFVKKRVLIGTAALSVGLAALLGAAFKHDSTIGRLLIWNNTVKMFKDAPVFGHGTNALHAKYMEYQAEFFADNPTHKYADLADNVSHPFNEYLLLSVEHGLVGILLLLIVLVIIVRKQKQISPFLLSLVCIGCFSFFSYPLKYSYILVMVALCCGYLAKYSTLWRSIKVSPAGRIIASALSVVFLCFIVRDMSFEYWWNRTVNIARHDTETASRNYSKLYEQWNGTPLFLYNYGAYLNTQKEYMESNRILRECEKYFNDYDVQLFMGLNYLSLKEWGAAEKTFTDAHNMIPNRFIPLYYLVEIYDKSNRREKADSIASIILTKPIKIHSPHVDMIVGAMKLRKNSDLQ